ncbi:hypothetical protein HLB23_20855 [Nocardia uniformis]|uniref:Uncharacterized protein n=1 Tax=Nocardia uniformis TaxID=53432 RepID=A0A849CBI1_9NOCA|nr:hypothetical protein [Nocardia uniformis]NNH72279.1 hypothetical protein [Nocardia uniformis]
MTEKKHIGLFVGAFICAAVVTLNPAAAWASGDSGPNAPAAPGAGSPGNPAGGAPAVPERPIPVPDRAPASPPSAGIWCPTF